MRAKISTVKSATSIRIAPLKKATQMPTTISFGTSILMLLADLTQEIFARIPELTH